jgi:hypothetical protein
MLSDPRHGQMAALAVVGACLVWFILLSTAADELFARLGMSIHAVTFVAVFIGLVAAAAAAIFGRYAAVKVDLLAKRDVVAAWRVDPATFAVASAATLAKDSREKRQLMVVIIGFVVVIFGAFAIYNRDAAVVMLATAAIVAVAIIIAYLFGQRVQRRHAELRSGEVIIGRRGLQFNGILHVWSPPLNRLSHVELSARPATLTVSYDVLTRAGPQTTSVELPVPPTAMPQARQAEAELNAQISTRRRPR